MLKPLIACCLTAAIPFAADAAILNADPTNLASVFARAQEGDTIKVTGTFGSYALQNRSWINRVTLDATNAVFTDTLTIQNVTGLNILRGTYGSKTAPMRSNRAVAINKSSSIRFLLGTFIGNGATTGEGAPYGMIVSSSQFIQVSANLFSNFRVGIGVASSKNIKLDSSKFVGMTSDGINIADSHIVTMTANTCVGTVAFAGAHPDCIQLWSVKGNPANSDIAILRNTARDATQGFTSFNASDGGGVRISMIGNTVATSYSQGVACYGCFDSLFADNVISTLPGAPHMTTMNIIGGANNIARNNSIAPYVRPLSAALGALTVGEDALQSGFDDVIDLKDSIDDAIDPLLFSEVTLAQNRLSDQETAFLDLANEAVEAVPEPGIWTQLILGLGLSGAIARRRQTRAFV